jgi:hypothetical protein
MNVKNLLLVASLAVVSMFLFSCEKQNMPENIPMEQVLQRSDAYYANLRAYKKSKHQIYYGWFGSTGGEGNAKSPGVLDQIPDSVDIVSMWGGVPPPNSYNAQVIANTQKLKGTRFVGVTIVGNGLLTDADPDFFKKYTNGSTTYTGVNDALLIEGYKIAAKHLADFVANRGLDGYDFDYEPSGFLSNRKAFELYILEVSKYLGPKSGTNKLLVIDAFHEDITVPTIPCVDYFVVQNYSPQGGRPDITSRINAQAPGLPWSKAISGENFEATWSTGGLLLDYARWNPVNDKKGGIAVYHPEYEYPLNPDYKFSRAAIQIMNPAVK